VGPKMPVIVWLWNLDIWMGLGIRLPPKNRPTYILEENANAILWPTQRASVHCHCWSHCRWCLFMANAFH